MNGRRRQAGELAPQLGNTMVVYEREVNASNQTITFTVEEKMIYGSTRLGVLNDSLPMLGTQNNTYSQKLWSHVVGKRTYELSNHLGNVLSVISDKVIPHNNGGNVDYYMADNLSREERIGIRQAQEESALADEDETATNVSAKAVRYSPFGVTLYGRDFTLAGADDFRYGFQNQEFDPETGLVNYKYRMHDPRIGRFFAIDPLSDKYPWNSTYAFSENRVIDCVELEGLEAVEASHRDYFLTAGIHIFMKNVNEGYSSKGLIFLIGQSATESSYGVQSDLNKKKLKNNFWGMKYKGKTISYESLDEGYSTWSADMKKKWPSAMALLKSENFTLEDLQKALNPGYGKGLNYDIEDPNYVQEIWNGTAINATKRMIKVIDQRIPEKEKKRDALVKEYVDGKPTFENTADETLYNEYNKDIKYLQKAREYAVKALNDIGEKIE